MNAQDRIIDGKSILPLGETRESPHDYLIYIDPGEYEDQGYGVRSGTTSKYYKATNSRTYLHNMIHSFLFDLNHDRDESMT